MLTKKQLIATLKPFIKLQQEFSNNTNKSNLSKNAKHCIQFELNEIDNHIANIKEILDNDN